MFILLEDYKYVSGNNIESVFFDLFGFGISNKDVLGLFKCLGWIDIIFFVFKFVVFLRIGEI